MLLTAGGAAGRRANSESTSDRMIQFKLAFTDLVFLL